MALALVHNLQALPAGPAVAQERLLAAQALAWSRAARDEREARRIAALVARVAVSPAVVGARHVCWIEPDAASGEAADLVAACPFLPAPATEPAGERLEERLNRYHTCASRALAQALEGHRPPALLLHVSCTGYRAPSPAEHLVAARGWPTRVGHVYHHGCYAAIPALAQAAGAVATGEAPVQVVHTELPTLHLSATAPRADDVLAQTLFGDGACSYRVSPLVTDSPGLELLATHQRLLPDSTTAMTWELSAHRFRMGLASSVPTTIARHLPAFVGELLARAGLAGATAAAVDWSVHPGGTRILDAVATALGLDPERLAAARCLLATAGNMSSATLPQLWAGLLSAAGPAAGTPVVALAFGPGLTAAGCVFRVRR